jgi:hypothetical protein
MTAMRIRALSPLIAGGVLIVMSSFFVTLALLEHFDPS